MKKDNAVSWYLPQVLDYTNSSRDSVQSWMVVINKVTGRELTEKTLLVKNLGTIFLYKLWLVCLFEKLFYYEKFLFFYFQHGINLKFIYNAGNDFLQMLEDYGGNGQI